MNELEKQIYDLISKYNEENNVTVEKIELDISDYTQPYEQDKRLLLSEVKVSIASS